MIQWLIECLRSRPRDRELALSSAAYAAGAPLRELAGEHDSFVPLARAARQGLLLGSALDSNGCNVPIRLPWGEEYRNWLTLGSTGSGKTTFISSIVRLELADRRPVGVVDCKGDLYDAAPQWVTAIASVSPTLRDWLRRNLVVVNPFSDDLVPLNICRSIPGWSAELQAYEMALACARLFEELGVHGEAILRHVLVLLIEAGLSFIEAPLVLRDEVLRGVLVARGANEQVKRFFLQTYESIPRVSKDSLLNRIDALLLAENLRLMLGAEDLIDFRTILSRGQPLLVFLGKGPVSEELVDILGSLLLQLLFQAAYARGRHERSPYLLCLDEFFHLLQAPGLARRFQTALTTTRSFGLFLCLVCHNFAQLPTSLHDIALGNCDAVAMFRTNSNNAEQLGDFLPEVALELAAKVWKQKRRLPSRSEIRRYQIEQLQRLPSREMLLYNRRKPHRAVRIRVPDLPLPHQLARTSEAELERRLHDEGWDRGSLAVPKATLKAQIEARRRRLYDLLHPPVELTHMTKNDPSQTQRPTPKRPKLG